MYQHVPWGTVNPATWGLAGEPVLKRRAQARKTARRVLRGADVTRRRRRAMGRRTSIINDSPLPWASLNPGAYLGDDGGLPWGTVNPPGYLGLGDLYLGLGQPVDAARRAEIIKRIENEGKRKRDIDALAAAARGGNAAALDRLYKLGDPDGPGGFGAATPDGRNYARLRWSEITGQAYVDQMGRQFMKGGDKQFSVGKALGTVAKVGLAVGAGVGVGKLTGLIGGKKSSSGVSVVPQSAMITRTADTITQKTPSADATATLFETPELARNPIPGGGIFQEIANIASREGVQALGKRLFPSSQEAAADAFASPTADAGVAVSTGAAAPGTSGFAMTPATLAVLALGAWFLLGRK